MNLDTALTRHAHIATPIIGGPMYPCSNPELVAAVSEGGATVDAYWLMMASSLKFVSNSDAGTFPDCNAKVLELLYKPAILGAP